MKSHQLDENGNHLHKELVLEIENRKRRKTTATIVWSAVDDQREMQIDAEVRRFLADLARTFLVGDKS